MFGGNLPSPLSGLGGLSGWNELSKVMPSTKCPRKPVHHCQAVAGLGLGQDDAAAQEDQLLGYTQEDPWSRAGVVTWALASAKFSCSSCTHVVAPVAPGQPIIPTPLDHT